MSHNVAAVILAAGRSTRLKKPKQNVLFKGKTLLQHSIEQANIAKLSPIILVLSPDFLLHEIKESFIIRRNKTQYCPMSSSINTGISALDKTNTKAAIIMTVDQPYVNSHHLVKLCDCYQQEQKEIVASNYSDIVGVPALFANSMFNALCSLKGDMGARHLIKNNLAILSKVSLKNGHIDIDTPDDLAFIE